MNREQKIAWTIVITTITGMLLSGIAIVILYRKVGMPRAMIGLGFMGIVGLSIFPALFFRKDKGKVTFDERDKLIKLRAARAGFACSYLFVALACLIPFSVLGPNGSIPVHLLPDILGGAFITSLFVRSVAILVQYGREGKKEQN